MTFRPLALSMLALGFACAPTIAAAQDAAALDAPSAPSETEPAAPPAETTAAQAPQAQIIVVPAAPSEAPPPPPPAYAPLDRPIGSMQVDAAPAPERRGGYMPTWALLIPGVAAFASTYLPAVLAGLELDLVYGTSGEITGWLYVPCVGPFVLAGYADSSPEAQALFVILGLVQTAGLSLTIAGLALNSRAEPEPDTVSVSVLPVASREMTGLVMAGQF